MLCLQSVREGSMERVTCAGVPVSPCCMMWLLLVMGGCPGCESGVSESEPGLVLLGDGVEAVRKRKRG